MVNGDRLIKTPWREIAAVEKYPAADDLDDDDDDDDDLIRDRSSKPQSLLFLPSYVLQSNSCKIM